MAVLNPRSVDVGDPRTDPTSHSGDYDASASYWFMIDTIMGGTEAIRAQGTTYLPRLQEEFTIKDSTGREYDPYLLRLAKAPFTNIYEDIWRNLTSKPFSHELAMKTGTAKPYVDLADNIDGQGRNLHVFGMELFRAAVNHGITWVMVDHSKAEVRPDGFPLSKADEKAQGLRPYWIHVLATNLIAVYSDFENGKEIITHARILEPSVTLDGYKEAAVERVRVLSRAPIAWDVAGKPIKWGPPGYAVWELVTGGKLSNGQPGNVWAVVDEGEFTGITEIPLIPIITGQRVQGSWRVLPPLRGLAWMQIDEYQIESNLQSIIELTAFPMLSGSGVAAPAEGETKMAIGPRMILLAPPPNGGGSPGRYEWIEPGAQSIRVVMDKLKDVRTEMRDLGMQPLTASNLTVITTGQVAVKANSTVQAWAINFEDALEQCFLITAQWLGDKTTEPEVEVYKDFAISTDDGKGFEAVLNLRKNKDVSREAVVTSAIRYGYLPEDFDLKADDELLATESEGLLGEQTINPVTGLPIAMTPAVPLLPKPKPNGVKEPPQFQ